MYEVSVHKGSPAGSTKTPLRLDYPLWPGGKGLGEVIPRIYSGYYL